MKTTSLFALTGIALSSSLMAVEPLLPEVEHAAEIKIAICGVAPARDCKINGLKDMEASEESIQSILQNKEAETTLQKLNAPIVLKSMEDAFKHLTRASMEKIDVDFEKQQVVIFAWQGSGQDHLQAFQDPRDGGATTFNYTAGKTEDLRTHCAIYAIPKNTTLTVVELRVAPFRCGLGVQLEGGPMPLPEVQLDIKPQPKDQ